MKPFARLRAHPRAFASAAIVTVCALTVTLVAAFYDGNPTTEVDLHDGGVWVTKQESLLVGHFNHQSRVLDGGLRASADDYDILQDGSTVLVVDDTMVAAVDPARISLAESADIPRGAKVALGAQSVAVLDRTSGDLFVVPAQGLGGFDLKQAEPVAELGEGADVTVGVDGTVHAVAPEQGRLVTMRTTPEGEAHEPSERTLEGVDENSRVTVTAVGSTAVVIDAATSTLHTSTGTRLEVPGADTAVLQHPSVAAESVRYATTSHLVTVPLSGGQITEFSTGAQGTPAAPVSLLGCTYGAWSGSLQFVRDCLGEDDDLIQGIDGPSETAELQFRVNRDVVVLNDVIGGAAWVATESMQQVDNWNDITPPEGDTEENEDSVEETAETTLPERREINTTPIAVDDDFGVRPGRTTVLPVLDNDSDADGDVLVASLSDGSPGLGAVQPIHNGGALQIAVPEEATGSDAFTYRIEDGRGGVDTATVRLNVHGWDVNAAPVQNRVTSVTVEAGGIVSYNVLPDWIDPDGDDVYLASVTPAPGDEADFTSDGRITYRALGGTQGRQDVEIVVSDGQKATPGTVRFDIRPLGSTIPVTNVDHVVVLAGQTVTVAPLANDTSAGREPLRLARVDEVAGATIVPDFANKTFSFSSQAADTYYVQYLASSGANGVPGIVRVDVLAEADTTLPPVAVRDVALLPAGGEVLVDVLANDSDPGGGILVVQSVSVEPNSGLSVAVIGHSALRIGDQGALDQQIRIGYRISNGAHTADGEVVVIPVPAPTQLRPPVANDDTAIVRAGDVVTIPVLANDYHPNGDDISLVPDLVAPLVDPADGLVFTAQDTLRFKAGDEPKTVYATYEVVDSSGQRDAGYVTIQILPINEETNAAPRPRDLTARALSGATVRIPVPLHGIDADGDSVELVGIASAPTKGRIVETGADYLEYEAFDSSSGVDTFTYRVRDRLGKEGTAPIRVGIAPADAVNQAPYAVKDSVIMRPSREVAVPVLVNDSDPEGDPIVLIADSLVLPQVEGLKAEVQGEYVIVTSPDDPVETSLQYSIRDARGATATAVLQVSVVEGVPLIAPNARDDRVGADEVDDSMSVDVDVLVNDDDPDGTRQALKVSVGDATATALPDGKVRVAVTEQRQLIPYTIRDQDGLEATAFIFVPAVVDLAPVLDLDLAAVAVEVVSGETIEIPLSRYIRAAAGEQVVITEAAKVSAVHGNGASLVKDQTTLVYTSAEGYFGQDAITLEVTDGTGPDDPDGRKAMITIPVRVLPPANQQPTFVNGAIQVAPGEDPESLDLAALATDPDPEDTLSFRLIEDAGKGLSASIEGSSLRVSAAADTPKGTAATLRIEITDGVTEPIEGSVSVDVTASTRPLPTANDDIVPEAHQGDTAHVHVLENDFNPFPDTPLKIVSAIVEAGQGTVEVVGDRIDVTPDGTFFGTMTVRYRIQDVTADVDREVEGRIRVTVQGRPDAPGIPHITSVQDRTVVLSWTPPANNGAEITSYEVTSVRGDYAKTCTATTCTLNGLTNNVEYNFTVVAVNRVGTSDPSDVSETARPDARPDTPNPPTLEFRDRALQVAWQVPSTPGSPVQDYTLEISPAPPSGITRKTKVTGTALLWEGLENGVNYQVRVRAHNLAPDPSSWSVYSAGAVPAAPPAAPGAPSTERLDPVGSQAQMRVSWAAPANNGDAISEYRLQILRGGSPIGSPLSVPAGQTSQALALDASTADYAFTVAARNKAGWGATSAPSAPRRAFVAPGAPTNVTAATPAPDGRIVVGYGPAAGNGANAGELRYEYNVGGGWRTDWDGTTIATGLSNGTSYTVQVRAYVSLDGVRYDGAAASAPAAAIPYGTVGTPTASAQNLGTSVRVTWSSPAANGRAITKTEISVNSGGWRTVAASGSETHGNGYQQNHTIQVRVTDAAGQVSSIASASARTNDPPVPVLRTVQGPDSGNCAGDNCHYLYLTVENFPSPGTYTLSCYANGSQFGGGVVKWHVPANGTATLLNPAVSEPCWHGGSNMELRIHVDGYGWAQPTTWR